MSAKEKIDMTRVPNHIAIIMDGNGRWAKKQGAMRIFGHKSAIQSVRDCAEASREIGVKYLTLYAFSTENWSRPQAEVDALMELLVHTIASETKTLHDNHIKLHAVGRIDDLPSGCRLQLQKAIDETAHYTEMTLTLALSYSGRWDIVQAAKRIASDVLNGLHQPSEITENLFATYVSTYPMPDPELMIRTSGENRISNFLNWQLAYTEFYITDVLWPDFRKSHFYDAIVDFQKRERRFGKTSEQLV